MPSESSWEPFSEWYDKEVGEKGHYYHEHVILPSIFKLFNFKKFSSSSLLDLGCGQGILERALPKEIAYTGIDISPSLIQSAQKKALNKKSRFLVGDITKPLPVTAKSFTHAAFVLSLQNVEAQDLALKEASKALVDKGILVMVLNHPTFRIPRQSSWGVDEAKKMQYRRIDRYLTPLKIPIQMNPGDREVKSSFSYHYPLSAYGTFLKEAGFAILDIQEWISDKKSEGKKAKMENRAREEFPLFLAICASKASS